MTVSNRLSILVALCIVFPAAAHAQATAQDKAAAEALFRDGKKLMAQGQYGEACQAFERSRELDPAIGTLMNLANCYEKNGQAASAWSTFSEAAVGAKKAGQAERQRVAETRAATLESKLARLTVVVPSEGVAEVKRDGSVVPPNVYGSALPVDAGEHRIEASAPGRKPWSRRIKVESAQSLVVEIPPLEHDPDQPQSDAPSTAADPEKSAHRSQWRAEAALLGTMFFRPDGHFDDSDFLDRWAISAPACQFGITDATFDDQSSLAVGGLGGARVPLSSDWALGIPLTVATNGTNTHFGLAASLRRVFGTLELAANVGARLALVKGTVSCPDPDVSVYGESPTATFLAPTLGVELRMTLAHVSDKFPIWASLGVGVVFGLAEAEESTMDFSGYSVDGPISVYLEDRVTASPALLVGTTF